MLPAALHCGVEEFSRKNGKKQRAVCETRVSAGTAPSGPSRLLTSAFPSAALCQALSVTLLRRSPPPGSSLSISTARHPSHPPGWRCGHFLNPADDGLARDAVHATIAHSRKRPSGGFLAFPVGLRARFPARSQLEYWAGHCHSVVCSPPHPAPAAARSSPRDDHVSVHALHGALH